MSFDTRESSDNRTEPTMFANAPRLKPNGHSDPAGEVGWYLQREREHRGISIEAAGDATGIHPYHIEAIEYGDMTHMPPRMEALEMIAGYAQYLGFDAEPLIAHLLTFLPAPPVSRKSFHPANPPVLSSAKVLSFGKLPKLSTIKLRVSQFPGGTGGIVASAFAVFVLFAGANWMMSSSPQVQEQVAIAPPQGDPMPTASTGAEAADVAVVDTPIQPVETAPIGAISDTDPAGGYVASTEEPDAMGNFIKSQIPEPKSVKPKKLTDVASTEAAQTTEGRVYGASNMDSRVVLMAKAPVWLRIEDAGGNVVMTQMLLTGDTYRVPNKDGLIALSRDGGRLAYLIDGKEKGILGPPGQILVGEKLDVAALESKN